MSYPRQCTHANIQQSTSMLQGSICLKVAYFRATNTFKHSLLALVKVQDTIIQCINHNIEGHGSVLVNELVETRFCVQSLSKPPLTHHQYSAVVFDELRSILHEYVKGYEPRGTDNHYQGATCVRRNCLVVGNCCQKERCDVHLMTFTAQRFMWAAVSIPCRTNQGNKLFE